MLLVGEIKKRGIESMALFGDLDFNSFVDWFDTAGGFDVLLPFLLVFTIVFAVLEKTRILGEDKKNFNVIIALVVGALLVSQTALVEIINLFIPRVSLFIVIGLMLMLLIGLFGGGGEWTGFMFSIAAIVSVIGIIWALLPTYYSADLPNWFQLEDQDKAVLLTIFVFILVIWYVTKEPGRGTGPNVLESLGKLSEGINKGLKGR